MSAIMPSHARSPFDSLRLVDESGRDYWSARDLAPMMGYDKWERFAVAVDRARAACANSTGDAEDHFRASSKIVEIGSSASRALTDWHLTRHGAYLVAMNGDPRKLEIAAAQTYFAVRTYEAETMATSTPAAAMPTHAEALRAWAAELELRQAAEQRAAELEPAARSWDVLASTDGDYSVREAAHILNRDPNIDTGERRLFAILRGKSMIDRNDRPYQRHTAHVRLRPRSYAHPGTGEETAARPQVRITVQGLAYLHRQLGGAVSVHRHIAAHQMSLTAAV